MIVWSINKKWEEENFDFPPWLLLSRLRFSDRALQRFSDDWKFEKKSFRKILTHVIEITIEREGERARRFSVNDDAVRMRLFSNKKKTACALCSKNGANWKCKMPCSCYLKKLIWSVPHNTCFPLDLDLNHKRAWEMFEIWSAVVHWCILQSQGFFVYLFIYCCMI